MPVKKTVKKPVSRSKPSKSTKAKVESKAASPLAARLDKLQREHEEVKDDLETKYNLWRAAHDRAIRAERKLDEAERLLTLSQTKLLEAEAKIAELNLKVEALSADAEAINTEHVNDITGSGDLDRLRDIAGEKARAAGPEAVADLAEMRADFAAQTQRAVEANQQRVSDPPYEPTGDARALAEEMSTGGSDF